MSHEMRPVSEEQLTPAEGSKLVVYAKNQLEYLPLPVRKFPDGRVYSEWQLSEDERQSLIDVLLEGKNPRIRLWQYTFNQPLQPVRVELV